MERVFVVAVFVIIVLNSETAQQILEWLNTLSDALDI